jgi:hypothetical protein
MVSEQNAASFSVKTQETTTWTYPITAF